MTQPLALVVYEKLLPGSQLVNRLQDLNYRVQAVPNGDALVACAESEMPMVVLVDLTSTHQDVCALIGRLHQNPATRHIPVIAFGPDSAMDLQQAAMTAGARMSISETAVLNHLAELLDQALQVE